MADTSNLHIAIIGGGPGGYAAAFLAADLGLKVTLIDPELNPGGVCLYRGCIPSKALLHIAKLIDETRHAKNWGIDYSDPKIDLPRLRSWKEGVVKKLTGGLGVLSKQRKVEYAARQPHKRCRRVTYLRPNRHRYRIATSDSAQPQTRNPAHDGFHIRTGPERSTRHSTRSRRWLHRSGTRHGVRRPRLQSLGRGDAARASARSGSRSRPTFTQTDREDFRFHPAQHDRRCGERRAQRNPRNLRRPRCKRTREAIRQGLGFGGTQAQFRNPGTRKNSSQSRTTRIHPGKQATANRRPRHLRHR